ncbi:MAG: hypothetical protein ACE5GH_07910, partial [Fidelibacterota bacterium]
DAGGERRSYPLTFLGSERGWQGSFFAGKPGANHYVIEASMDGQVALQQRGEFRVEESQIELNRVFLNEKLLTDISRETGGVFLAWGDRNGIRDAVRFESREMNVARTFQLSHWIPLCVLAIMFMAGEWISRRVLGLQ